MIKKVLAILIILMAFGAGFGVASLFFKQKAVTISQSESSVLLEKVQKVCKLVTVEGNFSELYDETNIRQFTLYFPLPSTMKFSKKAIIRVQGKVLVGYDMEDIKITADSINRIVTLSNLPEAEIISIDHSLSYENLEESWFNSFSADDYTQLNKNAKEVLRTKAVESRLLEEAGQQGNQLLDVIRFMVESAGWTLEYREAPSNSFIN